VTSPEQASPDLLIYTSESISDTVTL
jgi:hypothetical protein